ncbi:hypothetical protein AB0P36_34870 [Streptomyces flavidovirens]
MATGAIDPFQQPCAAHTVRLDESLADSRAAAGREVASGGGS